MQDAYINIMLQSLKKKLDILDEIMKADERQKQVLESPEGTVEDFDETVERKSDLIGQLEHLDSGFEKLYAHVQEELKTDKELYAEQIRKMKECIRKITDRSMQIQAQESRNKDLMTRKFAKAREQGRSVRMNSRITAQYYQNMTKTSFVDPQFMDDNG